MKITKNSFLDWHVFTYTYRFCFEMYLKKPIFQGNWSFPYPDIAVSDIFGGKSFICNFCYTEHFASCNTPLESSWGGDFKYIYFQGLIYLLLKPFVFNIKSLIIFRIFPKIKLNSTFVWKWPKILCWIDMFYLHQFIRFKVYVKKPLFPGFLTFRSPDIPISDVFLEKSFISNFSYRKHFVSSETSFESSSGIDFKYIYFYGLKTFHFWYKQSYHICHFAQKIAELTFAWKLPKILHWICMLLHTPIHSFFKCTSKKNYFSRFFEFSFSRCYPFRRFFGKRIHHKFPL